MKKFRFKLQTLLDQRQALEDQLLAELGELRREEADEMRKLASMNQRLDSAWRETEDALSNAASVTDIARIDEYTKALRDDIKVQHLTIEAVQSRVEAKRLELVEAMKERKVLEALRDKQEREYLLAFEKAEQNALDEMGSLRYARGM